MKGLNVCERLIQNLLVCSMNHLFNNEQHNSIEFAFNIVLL